MDGIQLHGLGRHRLSWVEQSVVRMGIWGREHDTSNLIRFGNYYKQKSIY